MGFYKLTWLCFLSIIARVDADRAEFEEVSAHVDLQEPGCPQINNLKPIDDFKPLIGDWHIPFMGSNWLRELDGSIYDASNWKYLGLEHGCIKLNLAPMPIGRSLTNSSLLITSKCPKTGMNYDIECEPSEDVTSEWYCGDMSSTARKLNLEIMGIPIKPKDDYYWVYIYQTEMSGDYVLAIKCFPKVGLEWAIVAKVKVHDPKIIKHLFMELQDNGIETSSIIELPYDKC